MKGHDEDMKCENPQMSSNSKNTVIDMSIEIMQNNENMNLE